MSFKAAAMSIAKKEGVPMKNADAILASGTRKAGKAARKKNPKLNRVPGGRYNPRNDHDADDRSPSGLKSY